MGESTARERLGLVAFLRVKHGVWSVAGLVIFKRAVLCRDETSP